MPESKDQRRQQPRGRPRDNGTQNTERERPGDEMPGQGCAAPKNAGPQDAATQEGANAVSDTERRRRRAVFLRELHEAKALRERVQPRRARAARMRQQMRMRTFRW